MRKELKNKLSEIYGIEETVFYPEKYAGTADLIGKFMGQEVCIDFKQSNKPKNQNIFKITFYNSEHTRWLTMLFMEQK